MTPEIVRIIFEVLGLIILTLTASKTFKYKEIIVTLVESAKDAKITEDEFQKIVDEVKKEIYGTNA